MSKRRRAPRSERTQRLRESRKVQRTRLGVAAGVVSIVAGLLGALLTEGSVVQVWREFGVYASKSEVTGSLHPFLLTYIAAGCAVVGGIGLILPQAWGWWVAMTGAVLGLADLGRIYVGLFGSINPDHPRAAELTADLLQIVAPPGILFVGVIALLMQRPLRVAYRVSRDDAPTRRRDDDVDPA